jgi:hypothetical protein
MNENREACIAIIDIDPLSIHVILLRLTHFEASRKMPCLQGKEF